MRRTWIIDFALRGGGVVSLCGAALAVRGLTAGGGLGVALLAAVTFLSASVGAALLLYGGHLLDTIELSPRWRRLPRVSGDPN